MIEEKIGSELQVIKEKKFKDLDEFASYYYAISLIEKKVKSVKEAIKKQGSDMLFRSKENITKLDYDKFTINQQANSESKDYNPKQVIEVFTELLGEYAWTLVESKNSKVNELVASMMLHNSITPDQLDRLNAHSKIKIRKGYLTLREKKDNKLICGQ